MGWLQKEWEYYGDKGEKHNFTIRKKGITFELIVRDEMGTKIDFRTWNDNEGYRRVVKILKEKYGLTTEQVELNIKIKR